MKKNMEQIMESLGELLADEEFLSEDKESGHTFSGQYQQRKALLLSRLAEKAGRKKQGLRPAYVCAALAAAGVLSVSAYAAVKLLHTDVNFDETTDTVTYTNEVETDEYIPPIIITANYLPDGYQKEALEDNKYSMADGTGGISIADASRTKTDSFSDISSCETKALTCAEDMGSCTAYIFTTEGAQYSYTVLLSYEDLGHCVILYATNDISMDDLLKVCENITIQENPEADPDHTYQAFSYDPSEEEEGDIPISASTISDGQTKEIGEAFDSVFNPGCAFTVTDVQISDNAELSALSDAATFYVDGEAADCVKADGSLAPFSLVGSYWDSEAGALVTKDLGTYSVKYVEVTMEIKNTGSEDDPDVEVAPQYVNMLSQDGVLTQTSPADDLAAEAPDTLESRGVNTYPLSIDNSAFYFDGSAFTGNHFYYTTLAAGETKTVRQGFAVPEYALENLWLKFFADSDAPVYVCIKE